MSGENPFQEKELGKSLNVRISRFGNFAIESSTFRKSLLSPIYVPEGILEYSFKHPVLLKCFPASRSWRTLAHV